MNEKQGRADANRCFACGPENPIGLKISFRFQDGICRGEFTPGPNHVGYDNVTHGGIIYSALDDVVANWLFLQGARGYTARCKIRYREAVPVGCKLLLEGRLAGTKGRLMMLQGKAMRADDRRVVAQCQARFMLEDRGQLELP